MDKRRSRLLVLLIAGVSVVVLIGAIAAPPGYIDRSVKDARRGPLHVFHLDAAPPFLTDALALERARQTLALDGYTGTEHAIGVFPFYTDVAKLMAASGITYTPTLIVSADLEGYFNTRTDPYADPVLTRFTPRWELDDRVQRWTSWLRDSQLRFPRVAAAATTLVREGSRVGLGSHGNRQGLGVH